MPARADKDGFPGMIFPYNGKSTPTEMFERYSPLRYEGARFVPDEEGAGEYRSGPALRTAVHNPMDRPVHFNLIAERAHEPPEGFRGGHSGRCADVESSLEGKEIPPNGPGRLEPGETMTFTSATPGGYGDPTDRDPDLVERDIRRGFVSAEHAREVYDHDPEA
jgi:N-methylhydantoinase B/oxoprolinase/acetone carboxylase alpha subunit